MAHIISDRVKETSATTGTGVFTLSGAVLGARTFNDAMADNDTCYYCIDDDNGNWELGLGTYSTSTLARTVVVASSNANSLVDFPSGAKVVFITNPAANTPINTSGTFTPVLEGTTLEGAGTYTTQTGTYTRVGKLVFFTVALVWTAHTGTGTMKITGLPFVSEATAITPLAWSTLTFSGVPAGMINSGTSEIQLVFAASTGTIANVAIDTAASVWISGVYSVA